MDLGRKYILNISWLDRMEIEGQSVLETNNKIKGRKCKIEANKKLGQYFYRK